MENLKDINIAFLPIGGTYTMNASEAARAANTFKPKIAMPSHYGDIVGSQSNAEKFKNECNVEAVVLKPETMIVFLVVGQFFLIYEKKGRNEKKTLTVAVRFGDAIYYSL